MNPLIFKCLKDSLKTRTKEAKLCVLMLDEIYLESGLTYSSIEDKIIGLYDLGEQRKVILLRFSWSRELLTAGSNLFATI